MAEFSWRGHTIEVDLHAMAPTLWLGGGFLVKVDAKLFQPSYRLEGSKTRTDFQIEDQGKIYSGHVQSVNTPMFKPLFEYVVEVDGQVIGKAAAYPKGWY